MRKIRKSEINQIIKENSSLSDEDLIKKYFDILYRDVLGSQAERMEEAGYEESDVRERREYEDYMDGYADILEGMLYERGVDPWEKYVKEMGFESSHLQESVTAKVSLRVLLRRL